MKIPTIRRHLYDGLATDEEKLRAMNAEVADLQKIGDDEMDFSNKSAMWVAYERSIESQNEDSLFNDVLAKHFVDPYGKRMSDCFAFGLRHAVFDPPGANIGFGDEGHVMYTAARTKLINDHLTVWLEGSNPHHTQQQKQVGNIGCGFDTRAYWLESLRYASIYWEVDTPSLFSYKNKVLDELKEKGELPEHLCPVKTVGMDLAKESIKELSSVHGFQSKIPTCWILEGLVMHLECDAVQKLFEDLSSLSSKGSYLILNFATNAPKCPTADEMDHKLQSYGWNKTERLYFGDAKFSFGRYPEDKPANEIVGFSFYKKP